MSYLHDNVGFWDSVLIENLTEETFISNIYQRYKRGLIYVSIFVFRTVLQDYSNLGLLFLIADLHWCLSRCCQSLQTTCELFFRCHTNVCQIELFQATAAHVSF